MTPSGPCVMTPSLPPRCRKKMSKRRPCAPAAACELRVGQISLQRTLAPLRWPAAARGLGKGLSHASDASLLASGCRPRTAVARKSSQAQQPRRLSYRPSCFASQVPEGLSDDDDDVYSIYGTSRITARGYWQERIHGLCTVCTHWLQQIPFQVLFSLPRDLAGEIPKGIHTSCLISCPPKQSWSMCVPTCVSRGHRSVVKIANTLEFTSLGANGPRQLLHCEHERRGFFFDLSVLAHGSPTADNIFG
jgi:hypothetical protein